MSIAEMNQRKRIALIADDDYVRRVAASMVVDKYVTRQRSREREVQLLARKPQQR